MPMYQLIENGQVFNPAEIRSLLPSVAWDWEILPTPEALATHGLRPWVPPAPVWQPPTPQQIEDAIVVAVQVRMDKFAASDGYDDMLSACTYATSSVPRFAAQGQYAVTVRDAHWAKCYQILGDVQSGVRPMPTVDEVLAEMPPLDWPV